MVVTKKVRIFAIENIQQIEMWDVSKKVKPVVALSIHNNTKEKKMEKNKNAIASVTSKIEGRTTLDIVEKRKILNLEINEMEYPIFGYLIEKYMYYFNIGKLDTDGGFYSTHDDFKVGLLMNLSKFKLRGALNALVERGYIKRERKKIEGSQDCRTVNHFYLNMEIVDSILVGSEIKDMDDKPVVILFGMSLN